MTAAIHDGTPRRRCGDCTACCSVMGVHDHPAGAKAPGVRCTDVCSKGCRVYAAKPQSCTDFACVWVQGGLPKWMRPDRVGVIFVASSDGEILVGHADPSRPTAWLQHCGAYLLRIGKRGLRSVVGVSGTGKITHQYGPDGVVLRPPEDQIDPTQVIS